MPLAAGGRIGAVAGRVACLAGEPTGDPTGGLPMRASDQGAASDA